jgi:membrane protease YdiL (CAAX protease family)
MFVKHSKSVSDSTKMFEARSRASREIGFWLLLFGSWVMLNSTAWPNQLLGGLGAVAFLVLAFGSLGRLQGMGMAFADWGPVPAKFWFWAAALGVAAGSAGLIWAHLAHARINVADNWRVLLLQVALGPVLEEFLFRGYLVRLLLWMLKAWTRKNVIASSVVVLISAVAFGAIHLLRPGTTWTEVAVISGVGTIYGSIRMASGSSATAAVAHALYNVTLHVGTGVSGVFVSG